MELKNIIEFCVQNNALHSSQLFKLNELIECDNTLEAWQTILGSYNWLKKYDFNISINDVELLANNIAKRWYENGSLREEFMCINGKKEGLYRMWYENGELMAKTIVKNGKINLGYEWYDKNGNLVVISYSNKYNSTINGYEIFDENNELINQFYI
jgi:antitoxin component YwqK of YwqJK toxin-antitoxin module